MRFRTQAENGLIMFVTTDTYNDKYMYFEILESKLYVIVHYGIQKFFRLEPVVSDGRWHVIVFNRVGNKITLRLDNTEDQFTFVSIFVFIYIYVFNRAVHFLAFDFLILPLSFLEAWDIPRVVENQLL